MVVKYLLTAAFLFFVGSVLGWGIEVLFRRFFTAKKWINPGFLTGPYLPLYGFGLAGLYGIAQIPVNTGSSAGDAVVIIAIMTAAMVLIEYIAGLIFIKGLKIKLWDYSDRWGNIQGIICPLFSALWLAVSAFYYLVIDRFVVGAAAWFVDNMPFAFVVGFFFGVLAIDLAHSINLTAKIKKFADEHRIVVSFEKLKESIKDGLDRSGKKKSSFVFPFKSSRGMTASLEEYSADARYHKDAATVKKDPADGDTDTQKENNDGGNAE